MYLRMTASALARMDQPMSRSSRWQRCAMPNFHVFRPCDATETEAAWYSAVTSEHTPTALVLTRQNLEPMAGSSREALKGGYIIDDCEGNTGVNSDCQRFRGISAVHAKETLAAEGRKSALSPCRVWICLRSRASIKESVLPREVRRRSSRGAWKLGWDKYTGLDGKIIAMESFAPAHRQGFCSRSSALPLSMW